MLDRLAVLWPAATAIPYLTPQRIWLDRLAWIIPAPAPSRWLLIADAACLIAIALASSRPRVAVPIALGLGFLGVNVAGMILTDFYLGPAAVPAATGLTSVLFARRWRWVGAAALGLTVGLGLLT